MPVPAVIEPPKTKIFNFCFSFDLKSYVDRKNPQACVDAFLKAFPKNDFDESEVGLVIKVHKSAKPDAVWTKLKRLASRDKRIHIIEETLSRPELLALYQSCNCYLSLHRAEGFGRGLAEALQLGLHVIIIISNMELKELQIKVFQLVLKVVT